MDNLLISSTETTPEVNFYASQNKALMRGESYPENAAEFYARVIEWLTNYVENMKEDDLFDFLLHLTYFNSSSSKVLLDIFDLLDEAGENGNKIVIHWLYDKGNETLQEYGEEFQEDFENVEFLLEEV
ncbi:MAG: DUF1987 domain-containing protein [Methylococcales bacterium]|nr:DUF1987 domain-containing protein [Methylococcales bacterium]MBT7408465.1 DUF1987 domain-containing protein [Methylococcales bacterium]